MLSQKYQSAIETSTAFMAKIEDLVREIAIQNRIPYYRIESQMEHNPHMGAEDTYMPVIRIITYFEDTVTKVTDILHNEFDIVPGKSIDKKKNRLDSFSYKHIQYFASLKSNRRDLTEYKRCGHKKFELQLCSMLQDAWSGIEKELGYDNAAYPDESKRDFYKVGALLELVDSEFLKMRTETGKRRNGKEEEQTYQYVAAEPVAHAVVTEDAFALVEDPQSAAPEVHIPEVQHETQVYVAPVYEEPQAPVVSEHIVPVAEAEPAPIVHTPIHEEPAIVASPIMEAEPVHHALNSIVTTSPIAPQRVMPAFGIAPAKVSIPQPEPAGFAPQRVIIPFEPVVNRIETAAMKVDHTGSLAVNIPLPEVTNKVIDEPAANSISVGSLVEVPAPAPQEEPKPVINISAPSFDVPQPIHVPETIAPVIDHIVPPVPEVKMPVAEILAVEIPRVEVPRVEIPKVEIPKVEIPNISTNVNGISGKTPDAIREQMIAAATEKAEPFFEDQPERNRVAIDENAPMTDLSLREYVINSKLLKEIDQRIAERAGAKINSDIDIEGDVERLRFLKVFTLKQLHDRLTDNKNDIVAFAEKWIGKDNGGSFDSGISLFYLEYLLVGKKNDPAFAIEYVVKFISDNDYSARYIIPTYNSIRNIDVPSNFSHLTLRA